MVTKDNFGAEFDFRIERLRHVVGALLPIILHNHRSHYELSEQEAQDDLGRAMFHDFCERGTSAVVLEAAARAIEELRKRDAV